MAILAQSPATPAALAVPIGVIKQFGPWGPEYEVLGEAEPEDGKRRVNIVLVRTGEETTYGFDAMMEGPEAVSCSPLPLTWTPSRRKSVTRRA